jgi:hypothetical protein
LFTPYNPHRKKQNTNTTNDTITTPTEPRRSSRVRKQPDHFDPSPTSNKKRLSSEKEDNKKSKDTIDVSIVHKSNPEETQEVEYNTKNR